MKRKVIIVGNGTLSEDFLREIKGADYIIGVDRAAYWLIARGIFPNLAIGDFDSVTKQEHQTIQEKALFFKQFSPEKDCTDMELAIDEALNLLPTEIIIYGAIGTRKDHELINIYILEKALRNSVPIVMKDDRNEIRLVSGALAIEHNPQYRYISVIPVTDEIVVTIKGCKYNVIKQVIMRGQSLGVSNELMDSMGKILIHRGKAVVVRSRD